MNDAINIKCAWCEQSFPVSIMLRGDDGQLRCVQHHHMKQLCDCIKPRRDKTSAPSKQDAQDEHE